MHRMNAMCITIARNESRLYGVVEIYCSSHVVDVVSRDPVILLLFSVWHFALGRESDESGMWMDLST